MRKERAVLIKKETEYAVFGLIALAKGQDNFSDVKIISRKEKIPADHLSKIFQRLSRAKLIESKSGPSGGFRLKKDPKHINFLDIMQAVQRKNVIRCYAGDSRYCKHPNCKFKKIVVGVENHLDNYFSKISLHDLIYHY